MKTAKLLTESVPQHVAIIMDGNGRWAKSKGKPRIYGHQKGIRSVKRTIDTAQQIGIKTVTLFAFSRENWRRPEEEVSLLMEIFIRVLTKSVKLLSKNNFKLTIIGDINDFDQKLQQQISSVEKLTENNTGMTINIAANYSGQWDIVQAVKNLAHQAEQGKLKVNDINESLISSQLNTSNLPEVDLLIRTGGESRISNFMLWQIAYTEIYFTSQYWPEFNQQSLIDAVNWFSLRERRFGCTSEQVTALAQ